MDALEINLKERAIICDSAARRYIFESNCGKQLTEHVNLLKIIKNATRKVVALSIMCIAYPLTTLFITSLH
jgi:hypothetical protein